MLEEYTSKRNFKRTPEPAEGGKKTKRDARFVIQEHHASHFHYDFRLEIQGTLKSWAIPKGIPRTAQEKRLAVATEDHPITYADFEGTIPQGEYGAGTVKIYDKGFYENLTKDEQQKPISIETAWKQGHIFFSLHGKRIKNEAFILQFFKKSQRKFWLLIKVRHE